MITLDGMETSVDLNILPLGSYDMLIGMDWLGKHVAIVNCKNKTFYCVDELGKNRTIKGIPHCVSVRYIFTLQLK
jgi:hypothetical protein